MLSERILITGASGFTGRYLVEQLVGHGAHVHGIGMSRTEIAKQAGLAGRHVANLLDQSALREIVEHVRPNAVVHLAGVSFVAHENLTELYAANIVGTRNLLQALSESPTPPSRIVLASSASVYGNAQTSRISEDQPLAPSNDYGISKAGTELVAQLFKDRLPITVTRPFNYTGIGQSPSFLIPKIVLHARQRASHIELGNLDLARDFSDVRGVADVYVRLLNAPDAVGETVNICSGRAIPLREILRMVEELSGHRMEVRTNSALVRRNEVQTICGERCRLETLIGPVVMPPIEETLKWMLNG